MNAELYLPGTSLLHRLDSRLKTAGLVTLSLLTTTAHQGGLVSLTLGILLLCILSETSWREIRPLAVVIVLIGLFYSLALGWTWPQSWFFWQGYWSLAGLEQAAIIIWRISLIFILTRVYMAVTSPSEQGLSIAFFITPLARITPKAADFSLLLTLTLRFIPLLLEEAGMVYKARMAKGNYPLGLGSRVRELAGLLIPLLLISFRRAEELAENLLARGYVSGGYRILSVTEWEKRDSIGTVLLAGWTILTLLLRIP